VSVLLGLWKEGEGGTGRTLDGCQERGGMLAGSLFQVSLGCVFSRKKKIKKMGHGGGK